MRSFFFFFFVIQRIREIRDGVIKGSLHQILAQILWVDILRENEDRDFGVCTLQKRKRPLSGFMAIYWVQRTRLVCLSKGTTTRRAGTIGDAT